MQHRVQRERVILRSRLRAPRRPSPGLDFLFHMFFLSRYCRLLEEGSFRGRTADFLYMLIFGACSFLARTP